MAFEEEIRAELARTFDLGDAIRVARERRLFVEVPSSKFRSIFEYAVRNMSFKFLCTITGQDEGENLTFMYHLSRVDGTMLNIKTSAPKTKPEIRSVTDIFPGAVFYERELVDLLGAIVEALPHGHRYPLTDNWPKDQHPLRKDWKPEMLEQAKQVKGE